jgi:crotonobetaine/carnitine-CoA ligase
MLLSSEILTIPEFLVRSATRWPEQEWCVTPDGSISRAQTMQRARRVQVGLSAKGVLPGQRLVIAMSNSIDFAITWFAAILAETPVLAVNPRATEPELASVAAALGPSAILARSDDVERLAELLKGVVPTIPVFDIADLETSGSSDDALKPYAPVLEPDGATVVAFLQTSGSTGEPKFIIRNHSMYTLAAEAFPNWLGLVECDVMLTNLPLAHGNAQLYSLLGSFGVGAKLALLPKFSATTFWDEVHHYKATQFNAIGSMLEILMRQPASEKERSHRVRLCYTAPAPSPARHREIEERFNMHLVIGYSQSEAGGFGLIMPLNGPAKYGSLGRPRQHPDHPDITRARIVDAAGTALAVGELGELEILNPTATPGYLNKPEESAALRRPDGYLRTGDLAWCDEDGYYYFGGRYKELIRHKGENLSPAEVEHALEEHVGVSSVAVIGVPSDLSEEDVKAFVVRLPGADVTEQELFALCDVKLPPYKRPRYIEFVDDLPETENHKIAKTRLPRERTSAEVDRATTLPMVRASEPTGEGHG